MKADLVAQESNMKDYTFKGCLNYEQNQLKAQDDFYLRTFGNIESINRHPYGRTNLDTELQRQDIDLTLKLKNGEEVTISEKNRTRNYKDILLEIYQGYPNNIVPGWWYKSKAKTLAYFIPSDNIVYLIEEKSLRKFFNKYVEPIINPELFRKVYNVRPNAGYAKNIGIDVDGNTETITLSQSYTIDQATNSKRMVENVCIPVDCLKRHGVKLWQFPMKP